MTITLNNKLQKLIEQGTKKYPLPYKKGKSIFIGDFVIRKTSNGFIVFQDGIQQEFVKSLYGALAIVKRLLNKKNYEDILYLDKNYSKHDIDIIFFKNSLKHCGATKRDIIETRLELSICKKELYQDRLEDIIFS